MMRSNDAWAIDDRIERASDGALATIMSITLYCDSVIVGIMYDVADAHGDYFASWHADCLRAEFQRPGASEGEL